MKPRETRQRVLIDARLRHERGWSDACILDISSRGLLVHTSRAPPRGAYVEICRGTHRIVARVVWTDRERFGARTRDAVALGAIAKSEHALLPLAANLNNDRRSRPREEAPAERHERNRRWGRRLGLLAVTAFGCLAAFLAFDTVQDMLAKSLTLVEAGLGGLG